MRLVSAAWSRARCLRGVCEVSLVRQSTVTPMVPTSMFDCPIMIIRLQWLDWVHVHLLTVQIQRRLWPQSRTVSMTHLRTEKALARDCRGAKEKLLNHKGCRSPASGTTRQGLGSTLQPPQACMYAREHAVMFFAEPPDALVAPQCLRTLPVSVRAAADVL